MEAQLGDSSDINPQVRRQESSRRIIRRWEDKLLVGLIGLVIAGVSYMYTTLSAQVTELQRSAASTATSVAVHDTEIRLIQKSLGRIEEKLDAALKR